MILKELRIQGFRSLRDTKWNPGRLNVIIGPNGSGKSNLLHALSMIAAAADGHLADFVSEQGGMSSLISAYKSDSVSWTARLHDEHDIFTGEVTHQDSPYLLRYCSSIRRYPDSSYYQIESETLDGAYDPAQLDTEPFPHLSRTGIDFSVKDGYETKDHLLAKGGQEREMALAQIGAPLMGTKWTRRVKENLSAWKIHHDFRTDRGSDVRQPFITEYTSSLTSSGQNFPAVLHTLYAENRSFREEIDLAMEAAYPGRYEAMSFGPSSAQRTEMRVEWKRVPRAINAAELSDGTLRFLFLLTVLSNPFPPPLIAIDEPETGLHPKMMQIVAELAVDAALRTQVIMTTHSDQFLDAFYDEKPSTTVATMEDGATILQTVDDAELKRFLKEFSLGSLYRSGELEAMV